MFGLRSSGYFDVRRLDGKVIGLHRFGLSAPGAEVMKEFGIDAQHVIEAAESLGGEVWPFKFDHEGVVAWEEPEWTPAEISQLRSLVRT